MAQTQDNGSCKSLSRNANSNAVVPRHETIYDQEGTKITDLQKQNMSNGDTLDGHTINGYTYSQSSHHNEYCDNDCYSHHLEPLPFGEDEEGAIENIGNIDNIGNIGDVAANGQETAAEALVRISDNNNLATRTYMHSHRARSYVSLDLRLLNDTVGRWTKSVSSKFPKWYVRSKHVEGAPNEIQYSVFKASPLIEPLPKMPPDGFVDSGPISKHDFDTIVENSIDAIEHLGIEPRRIAAGSSGSYFVYNTENQIVGVFKPKDEEPYGPLSPKWTKWIHRNLFPFFFGRSCLIPNLGYICEAAASLLDRQLQTFIVPYTDTVSLSSKSFYYPMLTRRKHRHKELPKKVGSFQLFLNGYMEANQFFSRYPFPGTSSWANSNKKYPIPYTDEYGNTEELFFEWTPQVIQDFRQELEKLVILDYIMRNTDRGSDNWMIKIDWETIEIEEYIDGRKEKYTKRMPKLKIGAIDSGLSWPWKHPDEWRSFPFGWLYLPLPIIGHPFSEKTRRHFLPLLTSVAWWEESAVLFRQMFARDSDFKERMWKKQWAVMKGQAFNVVDALNTIGHGPLELARRTRMLVWDDEIDVPVRIPISSISAAMETPIWANASSPLSSTQNSPIKTKSSLSPSKPSAKSPVKQSSRKRNLALFIETINEDSDEELPTTSSAKATKISSSKIDNKRQATAQSAPEAGNPFADGIQDYEGMEQLQHSWTDLLNGNISEEKFNNTKNSLIMHSGHSHYLTNPSSLPVSGTVAGNLDPFVDNLNEAQTQNQNQNQICNSSDQQSKHNGRRQSKKSSKRVEKTAATKRVIVERLETVSSKPPVFTWC